MSTADLNLAYFSKPVSHRFLLWVSCTMPFINRIFIIFFINSYVLPSEIDAINKDL